jgi:hypothetical protein
MTSKQAIEYIRERVHPDSDEPVFVFLGRDALAHTALGHYVANLYFVAANGGAVITPARAERMRAKAAGVATACEEFRAYRAVRLPD